MPPRLSTVSAPQGLARFPQERLSDAQLVHEVVRGDRSAFGVIWDRYSKLVRGVVLGAIGPDSVNEDLVQEVFLAFFRSARNVQDGAALRGYLAGVAVRTAALELRRRKVRRWVALSATGELPDLPVPADDSFRIFFDEIAEAAEQDDTARYAAELVRDATMAETIHARLAPEEFLR